MFEIDEEARGALYAAAVLAVNDDGEEVFTGLTFAETNFVFAYQESEQSFASGEAALFQQLLQKFHAARDLMLKTAGALATEQLTRHRIGHLPP